MLQLRLAREQRRLLVGAEGRADRRWWTAEILRRTRSSWLTGTCQKPPKAPHRRVREAAIVVAEGTVAGGIAATPEVAVNDQEEEAIGEAVVEEREAPAKTAVAAVVVGTTDEAPQEAKTMVDDRLSIIIRAAAEVAAAGTSSAPRKSAITKSTCASTRG